MTKRVRSRLYVRAAVYEPEDSVWSYTEYKCWIAKRNITKTTLYSPGMINSCRSSRVWSDEHNEKLVTHDSNIDQLRSLRSATLNCQGSTYRRSPPI